VRTAARRTTDHLAKAAATVLKEESATSNQEFDIFLSHSIKDAEVVLGVIRIIERTGKTVYVDWVHDPKMDRTQVSPETARILQARMNQCDALFYLHTRQSSSSRWMPWELGYFDGHNGNVAILPVVQEQGATQYRGEEYLGLYPFVDFATIENTNSHEVWINRSKDEFAQFGVWKRAADRLRPGL
jgi:hypothetical protein